jgi:protein SCO1/2
MTRHLLSVLLLLSWLLYLLASPAETHEVRPALLRNVGFEQRLYAQLPLALEFRDETGKAVQLRKYFSTKPVILILDYYQCPRLCPLVLDGLLASLRMLPFTVGEQFDVLTVSIDPP